jgi:hypothetical protein
MMKKTAICSLVMCSLIVSCVSIPPPSTQEVATLQRAREDQARGDHDWVVHDMEKYIQDHPGSSLAAEAHLLVGDAYKGQIDTAREEKKITGMILTSYTAPLVRKAYENYMAATEGAMSDEIASEAMFKAAVILDIDYMKNFERALVLYEMVTREFPGTTWAEKAQVRYDNLDGKFRSLKAGPHMIPDK